MKNSITFDVETENGKGILEQIYLTELGHVMVRIYYPERGVWINHNLQSISDLLRNSGIRLKMNSVNSLYNEKEVVFI